MIKALLRETAAAVFLTIMCVVGGFCVLLLIGVIVQTIGVIY